MKKLSTLLVAALAAGMLGASLPASAETLRVGTE